MNIQKYKSCREYRDAIRILYKKDLDYEGYMTCLDFQSAIQKEKIEYTNSDIWSCCMGLSIGNKRLKHINMATYYAKLSLKYASDTCEFFKSKTMLAVCYKHINKLDKVIEIYDNCIEMCDRLIRQIENTELIDELNRLLECKAGFLSNKGIVLNSEIIMYEAIEVYKRLNYRDKLENNIIKDKIKNLYEKINELQSDLEIKHCSRVL